MGQIIVVSKERGVLFNETPGLSDDLKDLWIKMGGADPRVNPRARLLSKPSSNRIYTEFDLATDDERRKSGIYNDFYNKCDSAFMSGFKIDLTSDIIFAAVSVRSGSQGMISATSMNSMTELIAPISRALHMCATFDRKTLEWVAGTYDNLNQPVILCDYDARVRQISKMAHTALNEASHLALSGPHLRATHGESHRALVNAIAKASQPGAQAESSIVVLKSEDLPPLLAEVAPLPRHDKGFYSSATAIVYLIKPKPADISQLLRVAYSLSPSEADVTAQILSGRDTTEISDRRATSQQTIKSQIKQILVKTGARDQKDLAIKLMRFLGSQGT